MQIWGGLLDAMTIFSIPSDNMSKIQVLSDNLCKCIASI